MLRNYKTYTIWISEFQKCTCIILSFLSMFTQVFKQCKLSKSSLHYVLLRLLLGTTSNLLLSGKIYLTAPSSGKKEQCHKVKQGTSSSVYSLYSVATSVRIWQRHQNPNCTVEASQSRHYGSITVVDCIKLHKWNIAPTACVVSHMLVLSLSLFHGVAFKHLWTLLKVQHKCTMDPLSYYFKNQYIR